MARPPDADIEISITLVRQLLADEDKQLSALPLTHVGFGWDNEVFRLGDELAVRLPRRSLAAPLVINEQRWLPGIAERVSIPIPAPIVSGRPSHGYPWHWSVVPWIPGEPIAQRPATSQQTMEELGRFLRELHQPAPADAPTNEFRGIPLHHRTKSTLRNLTELSLSADVDARLRTLWATACNIAPWAEQPQWLHGDLHPLNVLELDGQLSGIIDFGDITSGDPATDLAIAWTLPGDHDPTVLRDAIGTELIDDDTWARAAGWALSLGVTYCHFGDTDSGLQAIGERALQRILNAEP
ncbi:MAG: aminoglycoside phosphotransferase family protein [Acidimicrobiales bacterium]|nr:aminoglycoside phosphotransferase family protein [Acidimicrobiales bacterium]RZV44444.1 MAG: aminoglycoside phosphotransferase family protein [Acidimicrobiales bacterium]